MRRVRLPSALGDAWLELDGLHDGEEALGRDRVRADDGGLVLLPDHELAAAPRLGIEGGRLGGVVVRRLARIRRR